MPHTGTPSGTRTLDTLIKSQGENAPYHAKIDLAAQSIDRRSIPASGCE